MPTFYAVGGGWRAFAKAHMEAVDAPVKVVHGYTLGAQDARGFAKSLLRLRRPKLAATPGVPERRARTLPAAAFMLDRVLKRLAPDRVVFSALGLREGLLYSQLEQGRAVSRSAGRGRATRRAAAGARARFRAGAGPVDRRDCFPARSPAETRLRVAVCALSDIAWRDHPDLRAEESFRRLLQFPFIGIDHAERAFLAAAIHARYAGRPDAPWLSPAIALLTPASRRRAQILGRAILLAYRFSGGVPAMLAGARLNVEADRVRLEVGAAARAPDSEVVGDRLKLLAAALGVRRSEIVVAEGA